MDFRMAIPAKIRPCKYCGEVGTHLEFTCFKRPKKAIKAHPGLKQHKPLKKRGKVTGKWIATKKRWFEANKAPYYFCHYCNKLMTRSQLTLDHKESRSRHPELRFVLKNLVPCCWNCNGLKGSVSHDEYAHTCH